MTLGGLLQRQFEVEDLAGVDLSVPDLLDELGQEAAHRGGTYDRNSGDPPNFARNTFLDDDSHRFYPDWDTAADTSVAILRTEAGRNPYDKGLHDLVGELSTRSEEFRRRWSAHNVRYHGAGTKHFHHDVVGNLDLAYESVDMISEPGLTLTLYAAEPGSSTSTPWPCSHPGQQPKISTAEPKRPRPDWALGRRHADILVLSLAKNVASSVSVLR